MKKLAARVLRRTFREVDLGTWRLPFEYAMHIVDGTRETELKHLNRICPRAGTAVDVGANVGYYTYRMAKLFRHVYAFEPNKATSVPIRSAALTNVTLIDKGLSNNQRTAALYVPVMNGVALSGWASLKPGNCPGANRHVEQLIELTTLDAYQLDGVDIIKIDVEGHELEVLEGARRTIAASKPTLIVEIKKARFTDVSKLLDGFGYAPVPMQELIGHSGTPENFIFRERR